MVESITFTTGLSHTQVCFVDVTVKLNHGHTDLETSLYTTPNDAHNHLSFKSCHPSARMIYLIICLLLILCYDWQDHGHLTTLRNWYWVRGLSTATCRSSAALTTHELGQAGRARAKVVKSWAYLCWKHKRNKERLTHLLITAYRWHVVFTISNAYKQCWVLYWPLYLVSTFWNLNKSSPVSIYFLIAWLKNKHFFLNSVRPWAHEGLRAFCGESCPKHIRFLFVLCKNRHTRLVSNGVWDSPRGLPLPGEIHSLHQFTSDLSLGVSSVQCYL